MKIDRTGIPDAGDRKPLKKRPIKHSAATRDQTDVMARIRERFCVGHT